MGKIIRIDSVLYQEATLFAQAEGRTIGGQVEYWAKIGKVALDNPDLPVPFVLDLLLACAESKDSFTPFVPTKISTVS